MMLSNMSKSFTRTISPRLGLLGFTFLLAPISYFLTKQLYTLGFLSFIAFFGFYFEGKMSHTLKDERYRQNSNKAQSIVYRYAFKAVMLCIFIAAVMSVLELLYIAEFLVSSISLIFGGANVLIEYLTYYYDNEEY